MPQRSQCQGASPRDVAAYIEDMATELASVAEGASLLPLSYLLQMVKAEAASVITDYKPNNPTSSNGGMAN